MKKKLLIIIGIIILVIVILVAIGSSSPSSVSIDGSTLSLPVKTESDIQKLKDVSDPSISYDLVRENPYSHKREVVSWGGKVFVEPRQSSSGVELQVFLNNVSDKNFYVIYEEPSFQVKRDDFVMVYGIVDGTYRGKNLMGATLEIPKIKAGYIEKTDRAQAVAPAIKTITLDKIVKQHGFNVTLDKLELAESETRVYLTIKNSSDKKVSFYTHGAKLLQNSKQLEPKMIFEETEKLPSEFLSGIEASGVLVFPEVNPGGSLKLVLQEPYAETSFEEMMAGEADFEEMVFEIPLPK